MLQRAGAAEPQLERLLGLLVADELERARVVAVGLADALAPLRLLGGAHQRLDRALDRRRRLAAADLAAELARLLEVVGDDLDELVAGAGMRCEPVDEADVEAARDGPSARGRRRRP